MPHPRRGGLQIVFCDRSTPTGDGWNFYTALRDELAMSGLDPPRVRFVHDARNDAERAELFEACRDGRVSVLVGSTEKMGTGVNVQARAVALHHVDCPWRPADLEQREGRVIRQGNQNSQVEILGYSTQGSLDSYMWQTVERKQRFIAQLRTGGQVSHTVEDIGDSDAISYAEFKAASSGNPLILEREQLVADISRLATLERAHHDEQRRLQFETRQSEAAAESAAEDVAALEAALRIRRPTDGDRFAMTVDGRRCASRGDAGRALLRVVAEAHQGAQRGRDTDEVVGALGGFDLHLEATRPSENAVFSLDDIPTARIQVDVGDLGRDNSGLGLVRRLEGHLNRIDTLLGQRRNADHEHRARANQTRGLLGAPFDRAAELAAAKQRLARVEGELAELDRPPTGPANGAGGPSHPNGPAGPKAQRSSGVLAAARPRDATRTPGHRLTGRDL
jgi:Helicase conserved C-terminal domain